MNFGIYIQVPFCAAKCTYCNFHTGVAARAAYAPYARAVCREMAGCREAEGASADTIYIGGGTPSLLDPALVAEMMRAARGRFALAAEAEITLEADPETITAEKAAAWLAAGFTRVSMGAQSFGAAELRAAGRRHAPSDIWNAVQALRAAGFANLSLDLIAGLPRQTRAAWERSLDCLIEIRPEHVSIYMLEIDEGSRLGRESLAGGARYSASAIPSEDEIAEFYEFACARLAAAGYQHYEISNWALPGFPSRHNLKYWRREPYLGFGAGAHSFDGGTRWANHHDAAQYVAAIESDASPRAEMAPVTAAQAFDEEIFLGLRQLEGLDVRRLASEQDAPARDLGAADWLSARMADLQWHAAALRDAGLLEIAGHRLRLSPAHLTIANEVFVELIGEGEPAS